MTINLGSIQKYISADRGRRLPRMLPLALAAFVIAGAGYASVASAVLPQDEEFMPDLRLHAYCSFMLLKAHHEAEKPADVVVNHVAGFKEPVIEAARVPRWTKLRERAIFHHERGHCLDHELIFLEGEASAYRLHLGEAYSDSYAALMVYKEFGDLEAFREFADLRAISMLSAPLAASHDDTSWARYNSAEVIDHTLAWIKANADELATLEDEKEVHALARTLTHEAAVSETEFASLVAGLMRTQIVEDPETLGRYLVDWNEDVPVEAALRIETALTRLGVKNRDLKEYQAEVAVKETAETRGGS